MLKGFSKYMRQYKNILGLLLIMMLLINVVLINRGMAAQVQVCDMGAYKLYEKACNLNKQIHADKNFNRLEHIGAMSKESPYDIYCTALGEYGHVAIVTFYANKAGYVSKISIYNECNDSIANNNLGSAFGNILISLGLNKHEFNVVTDRVFSQGVSDVWVSKINRRIVVEYFVDKKVLNVLRITAYDD